MFEAKTLKLPVLLCALSMGLLLAFSAPISYASDYGTKAFSGIFPLLVQLSDQNRPVDTQLQKEIAQVTNAFSAIVVELNGRKTPAPDAFLTSIDSYRDQLLRALNAATTTEAAVLMQEVSQDAEIKRSYLVNTSGFSAFDRPVLVTVSVATFRGEKSEPGYRVTCNPFRDALRQGDARFPFASETNHASLPIPPGRYRLQLYKGQSLVLSRDVLIGLSSKESEEVRIDVSNY